MALVSTIYLAGSIQLRSILWYKHHIYDLSLSLTSHVPFFLFRHLSRGLWNEVKGWHILYIASWPQTSKLILRRRTEMPSSVKWQYFAASPINVKSRIVVIFAQIFKMLAPALFEREQETWRYHILNTGVDQGSIVKFFCIVIVILTCPSVQLLMWLMTFSECIFFFQSTSVWPEACETQVGDSSRLIASFWVISNVWHLRLRML